MIIKKYLIILALSLISAFAVNTPVLAWDIPFIGGGGKDAKEVEIWRATEQYVKLAPQGTKDAPPNDHPVELNPNDVAMALSSLEYYKDGWFKSNKDDSSNDVFTRGIARSLSARLADGLRKAEPEQDVVFAMGQLKTLVLGMKDRAYVAGRAFYKDGRLNIILGDYDRAPDKGKELAGKAHGVDVTETTYFFDEGSRTRSGDFNSSIITGNGIDVHKAEDGVRRNDWFVIDVDQVVAAAEERRRQAEQGTDTAATRQMRLDAARMQKEQRELRAEMARMRKEMQSSAGGDSGVADGRTIEERMTTLKKLRDEDMISQEEYESKREQILSDI